MIVLMMPIARILFSLMGPMDIGVRVETGSLVMDIKLALVAG